MQKKSESRDLTSVTKVNLKWITDLPKCKTQNYKHPKHNIGKNLCELVYDDLETTKKCTIHE